MEKFRTLLKLYFIMLIINLIAGNSILLYYKAHPLFLSIYSLTSAICLLPYIFATTRAKSSILTKVYCSFAFSASVPFFASYPISILVEQNSFDLEFIAATTMMASLSVMQGISEIALMSILNFAAAEISSRFT